jgi:hypothetical protein
MSDILIIIIILLPFEFFLTILLFDILLRGFSPFIASRPWVVEQILKKLKIEEKDDLKLIAFSSGRSGFFQALRKKYPKAEMIGVEEALFPYIVAKVQAFLRRSRIKIVRQPFHRVNVSDVDFIYSHLTPDDMRRVGRKFKFECRTDTLIVSTGFNYSALNAFMVVDLPDREGRLDWLSKNQKLFSRKSKRFKKEKKAFFYRI